MMGHPPATEKLPRGAVVAASALALAALLLVSLARLIGYQPAKPPVSNVIQRVEVRFEDRADGAVLVYDVPSGELAYTLQPGTNGFIRGVLRGLARDRRADHIGSEKPFELTRWADGRLSLDDVSTGRHIDLEVFGPDNAGAFAEILVAAAHHKEKT